MFKIEINNYVKNMDVIRGYINSVEPVLLEKIGENYKKDAEDLGVLLLLFSELEIQSDEIKIDEKMKKRIKEKFDGEINIEKMEDGSVKLDTSGNGSEKFSNAMDKLSRLEEQKNLLYKTSLMSIISTVECFLIDILKKCYNIYPHEITSSLVLKNDKHFTIDELSSFDNMDDARTLIIDSKLENLIRKSFEEWLEFLKDKLNLNMGYIYEKKDYLNEIFQRRNIVVHNKGIINSIYLSKVSEQYRKGLKKGDNIHITRAYLEKVIDEMELNFSLIAFELWKLKRKTEISRFSLLTNLISENLIKGRWIIVKGYSIFLNNDSYCSNWHKIFSKINKWLAYKRLDEFEKVKQQIEEEDMSACTLDFQACKCALLDNKEEMFVLLNRILEDKIVDFSLLNTWPIFDEYRNTDEYLELQEKWGK